MFLPHQEIPSLEGYQCVVRRDGTDTVQGKCRGLLIYCKSSLNPVEYTGVGFKDFVECAGIELPWGQNDNLKIVLVYRPPRPPFSEADGDNTAKLCHLMENLNGNSP